ncbi:hypothetical protein ABT373_11110 [Streptomyces sp. NPDC000070]|uniref:hypothetical protein n=1 Tax=Streptomyces sp. NPDC000070 TaxID=3154240 RepID=UPI00332152D2
MRRTTTALVALTAILGVGVSLAAPASAGGIGDFLSPAFGTSCANHHTGATARGLTQYGTGTVGGNLAGIPIGSALNQCGGADAPALVQDVAETVQVEDSLKNVNVLGVAVQDTIR